MKFFKKMKDGGPESTVTGYWLIECKSLFSICLLKFEGPSRRAYHTHAFNCISWLLKGKLVERMYHYKKVRNIFYPSFVPFITRRTDFHKVDSDGTSWLLTFRGPWKSTWNEFVNNKEITLTNGRIPL